jgi:hypothetical protein
VNERHGGFNKPADFKQFVDRMHQSGYNINLQVNLEKEFCRGKDGDQLVNACLLQFPYGICGVEDERILPDGSLTGTTYVEPWLASLTLRSQPIFQSSMFQLVLYSMRSKLRLLRRSRLHLRNEHTVSALAAGLDITSLQSTIRARLAGNRSGGTYAGRTLLDSVDSMTRSLAHTNEAAKSARATGEAMQHHFGTPSLFLTVTPDAQNCFVMQVLSGDIVDDDTSIRTLSEENVNDRARRRKELRLSYPGLSAITFEMLLEIVMRDVVGWDMKNNTPSNVDGLFGRCVALTSAKEQQGRLDVHVHMSIWIQGFDDFRRKLFFGSKVENVLHRSSFQRIQTTCVLRN